jgi:hypothetical protein
MLQTLSYSSPVKFFINEFTTFKSDRKGRAASAVLVHRVAAKFVTDNAVALVDMLHHN